MMHISWTCDVCQREFRTQRLYPGEEVLKVSTVANKHTCPACYRDVVTALDAAITQLMHEKLIEAPR